MWFIYLIHAESPPGYSDSISTFVKGAEAPEDPLLFWVVSCAREQVTVRISSAARKVLSCIVGVWGKNKKKDYFPFMNIVQRTVIGLVCLFYFATGEAQGFLKAQGRLIVNEKGEKVILRGMGLGGWMLQEGYMLKLGKVGPQHLIREKITELVGPEKAAAFYDRWLANDIRKIDIDS